MSHRRWHANWIWAPGINRTTSPAFPADYYFRKQFTLPCRPSAADISVAVDDYAEIRVNGVLAGVTGSISNVNIARADVRTGSVGQAVCNFEILVENLDRLQKILGAIQGLKGVSRIVRVKT